jgi:perosamine synthetase
LTPAPEALAEDFRARFGVRHCRLASTGRAGLTLLLNALRRLAPADRDEVVIPSYTCYSVAASIVKAGLKPRLVDIAPETLDFVPAELASTDFTRVLAIIATNLYGLPNDMPALSRVARQHDAFLIDDAAQAMGATMDGRWSGTWGDAGLYSFDKGKNVSAIDGGVVVTQSDDIARALDQEMANLLAPGAATSGVHVVKALGYFALLRPWLYAIPTRIPQLSLGKTVFTMNFPLAHPDPALVALGVVMMRHLDAFTTARRANAAALLAGLGSATGITMIAPRAGSTPAYLRLPVLLLSRAQRDAVMAALIADGIGATGSYPECLADVPELRPLLANPAVPVSGGRSVAQRILTLPTHPFVTPADVAHAIAAIQRGTSTSCAA